MKPATHHTESPAFDAALRFVLEHEGGYIDHPDDPGGSTKYGISLRMAVQLADQYPEWFLVFDKDGDGDVDADDVALFTLGDADTVYRSIWDFRHLDGIHDPALAAKVFDQMVVTGFRGASRIAQRALRACGTAVVEDGIMGSVTRREINRLTDPYAYLTAFCAESAGYFRDLDKPAFEEGWLNRAYHHPPIQIHGGPK